MSRRKPVSWVVCHVVIPAMCLVVWGLCLAEDRAFPTAEGRGRAATGARNASAVITLITTLDDDDTSASCSAGTCYCAPTFTNGGTQAKNWEDATACTSDTQCNSESGARIEGALGGLQRALNTPVHNYIIPAVSGEYIGDALQGNSYDITQGDFTYLGHMAPSKAGTAAGAYYTGSEFVALGDVDNWVIRYLSAHAASGTIWYAAANCGSWDTFRLQSVTTNAADNWIIDHSFFTGGADETIQLDKVTDATIQRSVIAKSPFVTNPTTGAYICAGYNFLLRGDGAYIDFLKNFMGLAQSRNMKIADGATDTHSNNINNFYYSGFDGTFNAAKRSCFAEMTSDPADCAWMNFIGNHARNGPECVVASPYVGNFLQSDYDSGTCGGAVSKLFLDDNYYDYSPWAGYCSAGTQAGFPCDTGADCGSGGTCTAHPCASGCGETKDGYYELGTAITLETSAFATTGINVLAGSAVEGEIVTSGTRDVGPNHPVEGAMLAKFLDYGSDGNAGDPFGCSTTCSNSSGRCPDGNHSGGDLWHMGKTDTVVADIETEDCTSGLHSDYTGDTYYMGACASGGASCNCDDLDADLFGGGGASFDRTDLACPSTDCGGGVCDINLYADADVDGIDDAWEELHCSPQPSCTNADIDPNSTTDCDNANWTSNGPTLSGQDDTTLYPCIELYSFELLSEVSAPSSSNPTVQGVSLSGVSVN